MTGQALVVQGDALHLPLPDESVDLVVTSPPYWALRSYDAGPGEIGSEPTPALFLEALWAATAEMMRVLQPTGSAFVDLGDKYASDNRGSGYDPKRGDAKFWPPGARSLSTQHGTPAKSLMLLPERYRVGCVDRLGLIARAVLVWNKPNCLSGGTTVYARCKGRPLAIKVHDLCRAYQPEDVQLWNGQRWTQAVWWQPTSPTEGRAASSLARRQARYHGEDIPPIVGDFELELRSGERIGCTPEHRWPTRFGLRQAQYLKVGDVLHATALPEGEAAPAALDDEMVGWFVGLYIAEGSHGSDGMIQIAGHVKELERYKRLCELAEAFHGKCNAYAVGGNAATINLAGRFLEAILGTYVGGKTAKDKHLRPACWQRSNRFLSAVLDGYLSGDGHKLKGVLSGWTVSFTNNDALAADLRTLGARLGYSVRLRRVTHTGFGKEWPGWRGTITTPERRRQPDTEIVAIRQSRARQFWDIGVEDDPHLFALASGVLTHNSLPESVTDRVRRSHEDFVHLVKQPRYYSATDEVREPHAMTPQRRLSGPRQIGAYEGLNKQTMQQKDYRVEPATDGNPLGKLPGSVWTIASEPLRLPEHLGVQHYAAFPSEWPRRLILGWSPPGICLDCGQGRVPVVEREFQALRPPQANNRRRHDAGDDATRGDHNLYAGPVRVPGEQRATILGYACSCTPFTEHPGSNGNCRSRDHQPMPDARPQGTYGRKQAGEYEPSGPWREWHLDGWKPPPTRPAIILDPFSGVGTTIGVARQLGRIGVGVDLSHPYCRAAKWRVFDAGSFGKAQARTWADRQGSLL